MKHTAWFWISTQLLLLPVLSQVTFAALPQNEVLLQRFVCNTGYTLGKCHKDMAVLRRTLAKYPVGQLGKWTWILVLSKDWKPILVPRKLDPDSPAFTYYARRETFIEEALVADVPGRRDELKARWHMRPDQLLDLAVAHELGHAFCNDKSEEIANREAERLLEEQSPSCEAIEAIIGVREMRSHVDALRLLRRVG